LLDDSNPFTEEEEIKEIADLEAIEKEKEEKELALIDPSDTKALKDYDKNKNAKEKAKMSMWTAFKLSAKNLHSKLKRTIMVIIAGSIGIIGVSAVLAVSQGVRDYIESIQDDLLSGNPIQITKSGVDYETLMNSSSFLDGSEAIKRATEDGKINVNSLVEFLVKNQKALNSLTFQNKFDKNYVDYVLNMPKEYYNTISLRYGMAVEYNVYADFNTSYNTSDEFYNIKKDYDGARSLDAINATYAESLIHILDSIGYSDKATTYANLITSLSKPIAQSINFEDNPYIKEQYDLVAGKYPSESKTNTKEILIVLDNNSMITDLTLAQLGFYSQESFYNVIYNALNETREDGKKIKVNKDDIKQRFAYDELLGKTFRWYPNNSIFNKVSDTKFTYNHLEKDVTNKADRLDLKVTGIVKLKEGTTYGALKPGFLFSEQTARDMIRKNIDSQIVKYISDGIAKERTNPKKASVDYISSLLNYDLKYYWEIFDDNGVLTPFGGKDQLAPSDEGYDPNYNQSTLTIGEGDQMSSLAGLFSTGGAGGSFDPTNLPISQEDIALLAPHLSNPTPQGIQEFLEALGGLLEKAFGSLLSDKKLYIKTFGGTFMPNSIQIFPTNFKMKDSVTSYLNEWNKIEGEDAKELTFDQFNEEFTEKTGFKTTLTASQREEIKYTDSVGLIIGIINTVINIVTYALVAFTALSLIVSTVMIAIITYVSVMERVKEIGVIRSLGGRKKDVSHLFNAEAFIIGALSGIFGVVVTYIIQIIGNIIINAVSDGVIGTIANLTPLTALIMILVSILLTSISGLLPARSAAKKDPVVALRTE
ncbi:MAG: ABC transporter permease, partial [Acholeplasmatales bacterium]|nr:ABC transporter permease [Acholeplasmatales bacterium]